MKIQMNLLELGKEAAKATSHVTLCLLALSAVLGACSPSEIHNPMDTGVAEGGARGYTVSFERNCANSIEEFARKNVKPPAKTVEDFPENPTCEGHRFVEWNTARDGSGTPFTAQTPLPAGEILIIVYAKWEKLPPGPSALRVELSSHPTTLTPLKVGTSSERSTTFSVTVAGFASEADADAVEPSIGLVKGLSFRDPSSSFQGGVKTFGFTVEYDGKTAFPEGLATISLSLSKAEGYELDRTQTIRIPIVDGQAKNRRITVNKDNIQTFNHYAITEDGLKLHYRLVENIQLPPAAAGLGNWVPIGYFDREATNPYAGGFTGSFDGEGHAISRLIIRNPNGEFQGLFGFITEDAVIENLGLLNLNVQGSNAVGGLVGGSDEQTTVQNSYATGTVIGGSADNTGDAIGGLVGISLGIVQNSYATCNVKGSARVGGLVGASEGEIHNSYATGNVEGDLFVGGLVGRSTGLLESSYATGDVEGSEFYVGGLVGLSNTGTVQNCAALNSRVALTKNNKDELGRVAGTSLNATMTNNHARANMTLTYAGLSKNLVGGGNDSSSVDGKSVSPGISVTQYNSYFFWAGTMMWDFEKNWVWDLFGELPLLLATR